MAEMSAAFAAHDFGAAHTETPVFLCLDVFFRGRFIKARPTGAGFILRVRVKQFITARDAFVHSGIFRLVVLAREGRLRGFHSANLILLESEFLLPLIFGFLNFVFHSVIVLQPGTTVCR